ncbi:MAG TPA: hypothetical protein PK987_09445 [Ferruginibacter sp.]|nr:hypothetical protein [Ferruginibacter sp.]
MKKIFTLLFSTAILSTAFAQYGSNSNQHWDRDNDVYANNVYRNHNNNDRYFFTPRERDFQIAQINREYDYKIRSVKNQFFMGWFQKKRHINYLENKRNSEINAVYAKFNNHRNKYGNGYRNNKRW